MCGYCKSIAETAVHYLRFIVLVALALSITLPPAQRAAATPGSLFGYSRQWGSYGGPSDPNMVALDAAGNVYVTDLTNYAVGKMAPNGTLLTIWGSKGAGQGQFNNPVGISTDSTGNVYVTDSVNNNVQKFSNNGTLLASWNSNGNGTLNGRLSAPQGVAVNASGYVYVVDSGHQRVGVFQNNGNFVKYFRLGLPGNFTMPFGIAIDPQGFVYVDDASFLMMNDPYSGNITKFTKNGVRVDSWGGANLGGSLFIPQGLAVDNASNIYVVDAFADRVQKFDTGGKHQLILSWGSQGTASGKFSNPEGVAVNSQANVFVSDPFNLNVQKFLGITGAYIATLAYPRSGQFSTPNGLAVDGTGSIFVVDLDNDRVQRFNAKSMTFINSWGTTGSLTGQFNTPQGVAVDHNGNVYVTDSGNSRIQEFTQNGTFIKSWSLIGSPNGAASPSGIAVDSSNHVYVTDATNDRVEEFDSSTGLLLRQWGSTGQGVGNFTGPQGIVASPSGSLYVVDSGNNRVEKFTSTGGFLSAWGNYGAGNGQFNSPRGVALDSAGNIYVSDYYNSRIEMFAGNQTFLTAFGTPGSTNGLLMNPSGVVVDTSDSVYVADDNVVNQGTTNNRIEVFAPTHDIAATKLTFSRNTAYSGVTFTLPVKFNITVANFGLSTETFWLKELANLTLIGQQNVTLAAGQSILVPFSWFPSLARGAYYITAQVQPVTGDPNQANNVVRGLFHVWFKGDTNGDCKVDIVDLATVGSTFGTQVGQPGYYPAADLNNDGVINIVDLVLVAGSFGLTC